MAKVPVKKKKVFWTKSRTLDLFLDCCLCQMVEVSVKKKSFRKNLLVEDFGPLPGYSRGGEGYPTGEADMLSVGQSEHDCAEGLSSPPYIDIGLEESRNLRTWTCPTARCPSGGDARSCHSGRLLQWLGRAGLPQAKVSNLRVIAMALLWVGSL